MQAWIGGCRLSGTVAAGLLELRKLAFFAPQIYTPSNSRRSPAPCGTSLAGARLVVASSAPLPQTFHLIVDANSFEADCTVLQRSGDRVDVVFLWGGARLPDVRGQARSTQTH